jgi:hypothetical protein
MVSDRSVCQRVLARGRRSGIVALNRFLGNDEVTPERLIEGWGAQTAASCAGRHVLAIQDTSEVCFATTKERRRGLGKAKHGAGHGLLLHAMMAVDADDEVCLGLVGGQVWTRKGLVQTPHALREAKDKESWRWSSTAARAKTVLAKAREVTVVADRESDIYTEWAELPGPNFHLLTRAVRDRRIRGGRLSTASLTRAQSARFELRAQPGRAARPVSLACRYGRVELLRPQHILDKSLPKSIALTLVEVVEIDPPAGVVPILWRLLTTHAVESSEDAWRIVGFYRRRWTIEQLFRTLKQQGLRLEDSQITEAGRLLKLTAIAAQAACIVMQLVHARDGAGRQPASLVFSPAEIDALEALVPSLEGKTLAQKNPHPRRSLAWGGWAIAKLGGWDGYARSKPPGPITFANGLRQFRGLTQGWALHDV